MGWNKDGSTIRAEYCDATFTGVVLESRVKYGGKVQYRVKADSPFYVDALQANRQTVLIDEDEVLVDFGILTPIEEEDAVPTTIKVKNLMSGEMVEIDANTPWCCRPDSETFWSM